MTAVELQAEIDRLDAQIKQWAIFLEAIFNAHEPDEKWQEYIPGDRTG